MCCILVGKETEHELAADITNVTIRALLIDDSPEDADVLAERLKSLQSPTVELQWSVRLQDGLDRMQHEQFDILLIDLSVPDSDSLSTLKRVLASAPDLPILAITGRAERDLGLRAVQEGAQDYLVKGQLSSDSIYRAIRYAIERKRSEMRQRLRESRNSISSWRCMHRTREYGHGISPTISIIGIPNYSASLAAFRNIA